MAKKVNNQQTRFILQIALSVIFGALAGAISAVYVFSFLSQTPISQLFNQTKLDQNNIFDSQILEPTYKEASLTKTPQQVSPALVRIWAQKDQEVTRSADPYSLFNESEFNDNGPESGLIETCVGIGFFVSSDGLIVTNKQLGMDQGAAYSVMTINGDELKARVVDVDYFSDIAVLRVEGENFPVVDLEDSTQIQIGRISDVTRVIQDVKEFGRIIRPWLGVRYVVITREIAEQEGFDKNYGAFILPSQTGEGSVFSDSPAEKAGLQEGDIIFKVNGIKLTNNNSLTKVIADYYPKDTIELTIDRAGQIISIPVILGEFNSDLFE
ncbi:S1C family serine protease [Patescibacteria group bacterium]